MYNEAVLKKKTFVVIKGKSMFFVSDKKPAVLWHCNKYKIHRIRKIERNCFGLPKRFVLRS